MALGLPFLDAMVPAATALAQTAAAPKTRAGFFYLPHGAIMNNTIYGKEVDVWTSTGKGADFKLGAHRVAARAVQEIRHDLREHREHAPPAVRCTR